MFIDEVKLKVVAGRGGNGKASFFANKGGPSGGNGGKGGDVYVRLNKQMSNLNRYSGISEIKGNPGEAGGSNKRLGANGESRYIEVPTSTTVVDVNSGQEIELNENYPELLVARGGEGGFGNDNFKTPTNQTPKKATPGKDGESRLVRMVQKLIADYGLIGKPNVGKSSLLNALTAAKAHTANYDFTTLEPNLGALNGRIIADIPGLIEGASSGKGLGIRFLKHIEKVKLLIYCIAADSEDVLKDFETIKKELKEYNEKLTKKNSIVLLTKTDLVDDEEIKKKSSELKKVSETVIPVSLLDESSLDEIKKKLV